MVGSLTAAEPPAAVKEVHERMKKFDGQLESAKDAVANLKQKGEALVERISVKSEELEELRKNEARLSDEVKRRAALYQSGEQAKQLEALKDVDKLPSADEAALLLGHAAKESSHEAVRRQALKTACAMGEKGLPAITIAYESLNSKDRSFLALELNKQNTADDKVILFGLMAKEADEALLKTLLGLDLAPLQRLAFLGLAAEAQRDKDEEGFAAKVLELGDQTDGDGGLLILYAVAKRARGPQAAKAVELASKRKAAAWPVVAAAFKVEDKVTRAAVVRAAKQIGGEVGKFVVQTALEDPNEELRVVAEMAVN